MSTHHHSEANSYTIIPTAYVIHLVTTLELNNQTIFYDFHDINQVEYLLTIFRYEKDFCKYIICASPSKSQSDLNVLFFGVNYNGTQLQTYVIDNSEPAPISIVRSNVSLYWRGSQHSMNFSVPNVNKFTQVKESILNIFTFPSLTYVVQNNIVLHFTLVKNYYFPSYMGVLEPKEKIVYSLTTWDWCQGTLVGKLNQQMVYIWNTKNFAVINQFSELDDGEEVLLSGGAKEYSINTFQKGGLISKGTYSDGLSYQANEIKGSSLDYVSLKTFVPIKNYKDEKAFLIAFSNTRPETNEYSIYAVIGYSSFKNTRRSIITENVEATLVSEKDDSFENYGSLYYKWDTEKKVLFINIQGFDSFLREERGTVILSDLIPYNLGALGDYNPLENKVMKNTTKNAKSGTFSIYDAPGSNLERVEIPGWVGKNAQEAQQYIQEKYSDRNVQIIPQNAILPAVYNNENIFIRADENGNVTHNIRSGNLELAVAEALDF